MVHGAGNVLLWDIAYYLFVAFMVAAAVLVAAKWDCYCSTEAPTFKVMLVCIAVAGLLWPVMYVGVLELAVLAVVRHLAVKAQVTLPLTAGRPRSL